jgi:hypothetical protein
MNKRVLSLVIALCLVATQAFAQQRTVTGKVTNDQGTPLAGVSVLIKGTGTGTLTNSSGVYSISCCLVSTHSRLDVGPTITSIIGSVGANVSMGKKKSPTLTSFCAPSWLEIRAVRMSDFAGRMIFPPR